MKDIKFKITQLVESYKVFYKTEFNDFVKGHKAKLELKKNKWGEVKGMDMVERRVYEIPETLFSIFQIRLDPEEIAFLYSKKGALWFAKEFPEFRYTEKV